MDSLYKSINCLPLKDMDGSLLAAAVMDAASSAGVARLKDLNEAIIIASYLHRNDTRGNRGLIPRDMYITHPLRNTLRLIRYGITDSNVLIACVLHDTVEDHPEEILTDLAGQSIEGVSAEDIRMRAISFLAGRFGNQAADIVLAVSNPIMDKSGMSKEEKRVLYAVKVEQAIAISVEVFLVKFADVYDNAGSLHHTTGNPKSMTDHLTLKYLPLMDILRKALIRYKNELPAGVADYMWEHLTSVTSRLEKLKRDM